MISELLQDFDDALAAFPHEHESRELLSNIRDSIRAVRVSIESRPAFAASILYNTCKWHSSIPQDNRPAFSEFYDRGYRYLEHNGPWCKIISPIPSREQVENDYSCSVEYESFDKATNRLAVANREGEAWVYDVCTGSCIATPSFLESIEGVAVIPEQTELAYIDSTGQICHSYSPHRCHCRKLDYPVAFCSSSQCFVVDPENQLVLWDTNTDEKNVLSSNIPIPVLSIRLSENRRRVLLLAGKGKDQVVVLLEKVGEQWEARQYNDIGPPALMGDISRDGNHVLLGCKDRRISIHDFTTYKKRTEVNYQAVSSISISGYPLHCVFSREDRCITLLTRYGQMTQWNIVADTWEKPIELWATSESTEHPSLLEFIPAINRWILSYPSHYATLDILRPQASRSRHNASVDACFISPNLEVVSMSSKGQEVQWHSCKGGVATHSPQYIKDPSAMAQWKDSDVSLMGNREGMIWQLPHEPPLPTDTFCPAFLEPIASLISNNQGEIIVASESGEIKHISSSGTERILQKGNKGLTRARQLFSAGDRGLAWSLREEHTTSGYCDVLTLILCDGKLQEVTRTSPGTHVRSLCVSPSGHRICIAFSHRMSVLGDEVQVLEYENNELHLICQKRDAIDQVAFLDEDHIVATTKWNHWVEIWPVQERLPLIATFPLHGSASSLATNGHLAAIGFESGDILSLAVPNILDRLEPTKAERTDDDAT